MFTSTFSGVGTWKGNIKRISGGKALVKWEVRDGWEGETKELLSSLKLVENVKGEKTKTSSSVTKVNPKKKKRKATKPPPISYPHSAVIFSHPGTEATSYPYGFYPESASSSPSTPYYKPPLWCNSLAKRRLYMRVSGSTLDSSSHITSSENFYVWGEWTGPA